MHYFLCSLVLSLAVYFSGTTTTTTTLVAGQQANQMLETTPCIDYETTQSNFQAAKALWSSQQQQQSEGLVCYNFRYTFLGYQIGLPTSTFVQVRQNGEVANPDVDNPKTIEDFFDMIESLCIMDCPKSGAERCIVAYNAEYGFPESLLIDMASYTKDEEHDYILEDFELVDCTNTQQQQQQPQLVFGEDGDGEEGKKQLDEVEKLVEEQNILGDSESSVSKMYLCETSVKELTIRLSQALLDWDDPPCYEYTYQQPPFEPVVVQVANGTAIHQDEPSLFDWLRRMSAQCIDPCDFDAVPLYDCEVIFAEGEGYPTRIYMLSIEEGCKDEMVEIGNYTILDCASVPGGNVDSVLTSPPSLSSTPEVTSSTVAMDEEAVPVGSTQSFTDAPSEVQIPSDYPSLAPSSLPTVHKETSGITTEAPSAPKEFQLETSTPSANSVAFVETEELLLTEEPLLISEPFEPVGTDDMRPTRLQQIQGYLAAQGISSRRDLETTNSPQILAAEWIANVDKMNLTIPENRMEGVFFHQRYILSVLYFAFQGAGWTNQVDFLSGGPECSWNRFEWDKTDQMQGVICDDDFKVIGLYNAGNGLQGRIPQEIGHLTTLKVLDFSNNRIMGQLPTTMRRLSRLEEIAFQNNLLTGAIKTLKFLPTLETVDLSDNLLSGPVDDVFGSLNTISLLDLSKNSFSGFISEYLYNFSVVDLHENLLSGQIPEASSKYQIEFLSLYGNRFEGVMPGSIGYLQKLRYLDLSYNNISGPIWLSSLRNLEYLFLTANIFSPGPIPTIHSRRLKELSLRGTNRTGTIPRTFETLKDIVLLDLEDNDLSGTIPVNLHTNSDLRFLFVGKNNLSGTMEGMCRDDDARGNSLFSADCSEVECNCCEICCSVTDDGCLSDAFVTNFGGGFTRQKYVFSQDFIFDVADSTFEKEMPTVLSPTSMPFNSTIEDNTSRCQDWEIVKHRYDAANLKLARLLGGAPCYNMAYTYLYGSVSSTFELEMTDGIVTSSDPSQGSSNVSSIWDLMDIINMRCIEPCPENGPYMCDVVFEAEGYPKSIAIVEDSLFHDEEEKYLINTFDPYECPSEVSTSHPPFPGSETMAPSGQLGGIKFIPFIFHVALYGDLDREALMVALVEYLTSELRKWYENIIRIELTQSTIYAKDERQRLQAKLYFSGAAFFSGPLPDEEDVLSKQAEALSDTKTIQDSITNNADVGTGAVVSHIEILVDNNTERPPTSVGGPTVSGSHWRKISTLLVCATIAVLETLL